jgi:glucose-6-phosphate isomerase
MSAGWDRARRADFAARLWQKDPTLWSTDPAHQKVAASRLGWLDLPTGMPSGTQALRRFASEVVTDGYTHAVLLGMGGSSLAPEVMRHMLGVRPGFLDLTVLDNTSPSAIRAVTDSHDPARTLFLVSSKSGTTIEAVCFERYFFEWVRSAIGGRARRSFVAVTDTDTPLEERANRQGYRRVFLNASDVGGRYSALSLFGLVPAALIGADLDGLLDSAADELAAARQDPGGGPGVALGAELGAAALAGSDKLTLAFGPDWGPLGPWVEQLVAESTGKDGRGILPVEGEPHREAALASRDRAFVTTPDLDPSIGRAIAHSDRPAWLLDLPGTGALGAAFLRWEVATVTAGAVLGVNPFDEPNVAEAKQSTREVLVRALEQGRIVEKPPLGEAAGCRFWAAGRAERALGEKRAADGASAITALLSLAQPGDYLALLPYLHRTPGVHQRLQRLRTAAGDLSGLATTLGYGPRFLHSTGQLHKGGPDTGLLLQITADEGPDIGIPGERYGFGMLRDAQAAGDFEVLARRGRRVVRVHLGTEVERGLDALTAGVEGLTKA